MHVLQRYCKPSGLDVQRLNSAAGFSCPHPLHLLVNQGLRLSERFLHRTTVYEIDSSVVPDNVNPHLPLANDDHLAIPATVPVAVPQPVVHEALDASLAEC